MMIAREMESLEPDAKCVGWHFMKRTGPLCGSLKPMGGAWDNIHGKGMFLLCAECVSIALRTLTMIEVGLL